MIKTTFLTPPALALALLAGCQDGIEPVPFQGISGTVTFLGALPDSTEWVRVATYRDLPETELDLLSFAAISESLVLGADSAAYVVPLDTGLYEWVPVVWKREGVALPGGLRILGWYSDGAGAFDPPGAVPVVADEETSGIAVIADFQNALTIQQALEALK